MTAVDAAVELVAEPTEGRIFTQRRRVRLGDVTTSGRLRLDAIARYLQDVANDDAVDAALPGAMFWVVRRTLVEVRRPPRLREDLEVRTFCGGIGSRWAERRTRLIGADGGLVETATLWVCVDERTMRPSVVPPEFGQSYGQACGERRVRGRLRLADPPPEGTVTERWPLRTVDLDVLDHVNNAAYWAPVEEALAGWTTRRVRAELEYRAGIDAGAAVTVERAIGRGRDDGISLWLRADGVVQAAAWVSPLDGERHDAAA